MTIGIIGLGLMGGSLGLAIKKSKLPYHVIGWDLSSTNNTTAKERNLVDEIVEKSVLISNSDVIILAINVNGIHQEIIKILEKIKPHQTLIDLGSTKDSIARLVEKHPNRSQYIAAHPIAGTEFSGPENAIESLYKNKQMIFCDTEKSNPNHYAIAKSIFIEIGMEISELGSYSHDLYIAYVSHLSHIISFSLSSTVLDKEKMYDDITMMAGSGFASTVRLAKSSPQMWLPIVKHNKENILSAIIDFKNALSEIENLISNEEWENVERYFSRANEIKKLLE